MQIAINRLEDCLLDVSHWMAHNGLKLNNDKTIIYKYLMATQNSPNVLHSLLEQKLLNRAPQFETLELD